MCARGAAEAAGRRGEAGARNEASLWRGRWRRGGTGCSYVFNVIRNSRSAQARGRTIARSTSIGHEPFIVCSGMRSGPLVDGPLSLQVRRTANSWGEPNEEWTMNGECGGAGYAPNLRTMGRWALYANRSIARLVRSITVRRLSYGTENSRALTTTSRNTNRPHPLIDGQVYTKM